MRFIGMMRVKIHTEQEAGWFRRSLASIRFCERIFVLDDHSICDAVSICGEFPHVTVFRSEFQGFHEGRDREFLARKAQEIGADWVIGLDADEILELKAQEKIEDVINTWPNANCVGGWWINLWGDENTIRVDGRWKHRTIFPLWRMPKVETIRFEPMHYRLPIGFEPVCYEITFRVLHFGMFDASLRLAKHKRYMEIDPDLSANLPLYLDRIRGDVGGLPASGLRFEKIVL